MAYAQNTTVSVEKSRAEIERVLDKHGEPRYVVESALSPGLLHIFSESQLAPATEEEVDVVAVKREDVEMFVCAVNEAEEWEHIYSREHANRLRDAMRRCSKLIEPAIANGGEPGGAE